MNDMSTVKNIKSLKICKKGCFSVTLFNLSYKNRDFMLTNDVGNGILLLK